MDTLKKTLAFAIIAAWAITLNAAAQYKANFHVFHGNIAAKTQGIVVQLHSATGYQAGQVRIVHVASNRVRVLDFNPAFVQLSDHNVYTSALATTDWACALGDVVRVEILRDGAWHSLGESKVKAR